jgi:hypothetical protein
MAVEGMIPSKVERATIPSRAGSVMTSTFFLLGGNF